VHSCIYLTFMTKLALNKILTEVLIEHLALVVAVKLLTCEVLCACVIGATHHSYSSPCEVVCAGGIGASCRSDVSPLFSPILSLQHNDSHKHISVN
jgi:hypothetical protein